MSAHVESLTEEIAELDRLIASQLDVGADVVSLRKRREELVKRLNEANRALEGEQQLLKGGTQPSGQVLKG